MPWILNFKRKILFIFATKKDSVSTCYRRLKMLKTLKMLEKNINHNHLQHPFIDILQHLKLNLTYTPLFTLVESTVILIEIPLESLDIHLLQSHVPILVLGISIYKITLLFLKV